MCVKELTPSNGDAPRMLPLQWTLLPLADAAAQGNVLFRPAAATLRLFSFAIG